MTPDFDPTSVDWNNPDVEYIMKHVKMAMTNRDDEIGALKKTNGELTAANNEILDHVKETPVQIRQTCRSLPPA